MGFGEIFKKFERFFQGIPVGSWMGREGSPEFFSAAGARQAPSLLFFLPGYPSFAGKRWKAINLEKNRAIFVFLIFVPCVLSTTAIVGTVVGAVSSPPLGAIEAGRSQPSLAAWGGEEKRGSGPLFWMKKRRKERRKWGKKRKKKEQTRRKKRKERKREKKDFLSPLSPFSLFPLPSFSTFSL